MLYHVAIPTDVSLLSLSRRQSRAAGLQRMTSYVLTGDTRSRKIFVSNKTVDESHSARILIGCKPISYV